MKKLSLLLATIIVLITTFSACGLIDKITNENSQTSVNNQKNCSHNYQVTSTIHPTCTTEGYSNYKCTLCGVTKKDNVTKKTEHNYVEHNKINATCLEKGYTVYKCVNCGSTYNDDYSDYGFHKGIKTCTVCKKDLYQIFANYIKKNGKFDEDNYSFSKTFVFDDGDIALFTYSYYTDSENIFLGIAYGDYITNFSIDKDFSGKYTYFMADLDFANVMTGTVYASSFTSNTILTYTATNFSSYLTSSVRKLASTQVSMIVIYAATVLSEIDMSISNIGFTSYQ